MPRAALYIRVSTDEQAASAEAQEAGGRAWCAKNDHEVAAVYKDVGVSGAEWVKRPGILALEADARRRPPPWEMVVVMFQDRLGRDPERVALLLATLHTAKVKVFEWPRNAEVPLDTLGRMYATLRGYMAAHEREMTSARTRAALRQKAERGLVVGGSVYGYRNDRRQDGVHYVVHEGEASTVREIYQRHIEGESARKIAQRLNRARVPSPRAEGGGSGSWCTSKVYGILRSDRYKGVVRWGVLGSEYEDFTRKTVVRPDEEVVEVVRPELAIVDPETWERAQSRTDRVRVAQETTVKRGEPKYLLVGHAVCGACGGPLGSARTSTGNGDRKRVVPAYTCLWHRDRGLCEETWCRQTSTIDAVVIEWMARDVFDPDLIAETIAAVRRRAKEADAGAPNPRLVELRAEEQALATAVSRLVLAIENADDVPELLVRFKERRAQLEAVRVELGRITTPAPLIPVNLEARILTRARSLREMLTRVGGERPDLVRDLLGACLVGSIKVTSAGPRKPLLLEGRGSPGCLLSLETTEESRQPRGMLATPTGFEPVLPT